MVKKAGPPRRVVASPAGTGGPGPAPGSEFLARAIEAAGFGILALDRADGRVRYVNEAGAGILGTATDEFRDEAWELFRRTLLSEAEGTPNGTKLSARSLRLGTALIGYSLYPDEDEVWVFFRDVSEKEHLSSVAEALRLSDALLEVFTSLRHDLGNSVNVARTSLEVLRRGTGRLDEEGVRRYVDRALEALARIGELLGTLRDFSATRTPPLRPVPIGEVVESAVLDRGRPLAEAGTTLDVEVEPGPLEALANPASLEDALCDLVDRAAARARRVEPNAVLVRAEGRRETVTIRIEPRGAGAADSSPGEGDLGLLVVRRRLSLMDGTVDTDGAAATVTLRRVRDPA